MSTASAQAQITWTGPTDREKKITELKNDVVIFLRLQMTH